MQIKITQQIRAAYGSFEPGDIADIEDRFARGLIEAGAAEAIDNPPAKAVIETAEAAPAETATVKRGRPRKA